MSGFGGHGNVLLSIPVQSTFSQTCARRDDRSVRRLAIAALVQYQEIILSKR